MGDNPFWKQKINIGSANNQKFVQIPFDRMKGIIEYQADRHGIRVMRQEESYTSKASFLDRDPIPSCGVDDEEAHFSGKRVYRGLYVSKDRTIMNADINGSANIMRKCIPDAFEGKPFRYDRIAVIRHPMYDAVAQNRAAQKHK